MPDPHESGRPLDITVRSATGSGRTLLAAFDDALLSAGVGDLNLITLSSVIPPHTRSVKFLAKTCVDGLLACSVASDSQFGGTMG